VKEPMPMDKTKILIILFHFLCAGFEPFAN